MHPRAVGSPASLRQANQRRVVAAVRQAGALTQAEIARRTGLSPATVSNVVRHLTGTGLLDVTVSEPGRRRTSTVRINRAAGVAIGVDFGHRHLRVAIGDLSYDVLAEESRPLPSDHTATDGIALAAELVDQLLVRVGCDRDRVIGVGLGLPAPIDRVTGHVGSASILPGWVGIPAADALGSRLGLPTLVDNDANLGALGEVIWGAGSGCTDLAYIKVSTGIGAGLLIDGHIHRGASGTAGEIGHTTIDEHGRVCQCGNRGCLETLAAGPFIVEMLRPSLGADLTLARAVELACQGDAGCRRVIADAGRHIGVAVANLCNLINPERVVVGGDVAAAGELLLAPLREIVSRQAIPSAAADVTIVSGQLGDRAEVLGALALALRESQALGLADVS